MDLPTSQDVDDSAIPSLSDPAFGMDSGAAKMPNPIAPPQALKAPANLQPRGTSVAMTKPSGKPVVAQGGNNGTKGVPSSHSPPEFLYQLTKMLKDDNREIIEWNEGTYERNPNLFRPTLVEFLAFGETFPSSLKLRCCVNRSFLTIPISGQIEVHSPIKLESQVLQKYFRHSKFASFQRQLNYFGFRKLAGKGKMAPCSYINEGVTEELDSILRIKVRAVL